LADRTSILGVATPLFPVDLVSIGLSPRAQSSGLRSVLSQDRRKVPLRALSCSLHELCPFSPIASALGFLCAFRPSSPSLSMQTLCYIDNAHVTTQTSLWLVSDRATRRPGDAFSHCLQALESFRGSGHGLETGPSRGGWVVRQCHIRPAMVQIPYSGSRWTTVHRPRRGLSFAWSLQSAVLC